MNEVVSKEVRREILREVGWKKRLFGPLVLTSVVLALVGACLFHTMPFLPALIATVLCGGVVFGITVGVWEEDLVMERLGFP